MELRCKYYEDAEKLLKALKVTWAAFDTYVHGGLGWEDDDNIGKVREALEYSNKTIAGLNIEKAKPLKVKL